MWWLLLCIAGALLILFAVQWRVGFDASWNLDGRISGELRLWGIRIRRFPDLLHLAARHDRSAAPQIHRKTKLRMTWQALGKVADIRLVILPNCLVWDPALLWDAAGCLKAVPLPIKVSVRPWPLNSEHIGEARTTAQFRPIVLAAAFLRRKKLADRPSISEKTAHKEAYAMGKVDQILSDVERLISTKTVIGEPMTTGGITLIPVTSVSFGLGTGERGEDKGQTDGVATGFRVSPVAIIVIRDGDVSVLPVNGTANPERLIGMLPDLWEKLKSKKAKTEERQTSEDAKG